MSTNAKAAKEITVARITSRPIVIAAAFGLIATLGGAAISHVEWSKTPTSDDSSELRGYCVRSGATVLAALQEKAEAIDKAKLDAIQQNQLKLVASLDSFALDTKATKETVRDLHERLIKAIDSGDKSQQNTLRTELNIVTFKFNSRYHFDDRRPVLWDIQNEQFVPNTPLLQPAVPRKPSVLPKVDQLFQLPVATSMPAPIYGSFEKDTVAMRLSDRRRHSDTARNVFECMAEHMPAWDVYDGGSVAGMFVRTNGGVVGPFTVSYTDKLPTLVGRFSFRITYYKTSPTQSSQNDSFVAVEPTESHKGSTVRIPAQWLLPTVPNQDSETRTDSTDQAGLSQ